MKQHGALENAAYSDRVCSKSQKKKINQQNSVWFEAKGSSSIGLDNRSEASLLHWHTRGHSQISKSHLLSVTKTRKVAPVWCLWLKTSKRSLEKCKCFHADCYKQGNYSKTSFNSKTHKLITEKFTHNKILGLSRQVCHILSLGNLTSPAELIVVQLCDRQWCMAVCKRQNSNTRKSTKCPLENNSCAQHWFLSFFFFFEVLSFKSKLIHFPITKGHTTTSFFSATIGEYCISPSSASRVR